MALCARYIPYGQRIIRGHVTWSAAQAVSRKHPQHCSSCCQRQRGMQPSRSFFNFFRGSKTADQSEPERLLPTFPVIHTLGKVGPIRTVPKHIPRPEWAENGWVAKKPLFPQLLDTEDQNYMREAGQVARRILDLAASHLKLGITTDYIDEVVHSACIEKNVYPSTLNYYGFPKSVCTSINNIMVHGIPDDRPLQDGDIINLDITIYKDGFHADLSETYLIGNVNDAGKHLVHVARKCRDEAIKQCGPNKLISVIGDTIGEICKAEGFVVGVGFDGHGIGRYFHCKPSIWHYPNTYSETMDPGMAITIEPVILETPDKPCRADDMWTIYAQNHTRSAQFEHTVLITQHGYEVLTAGENESFKTEAQRSATADSVVREQSKSNSLEEDWRFK